MGILLVNEIQEVYRLQGVEVPFWAHQARALVQISSLTVMVMLRKGGFGFRGLDWVPIPLCAEEG